MSNLRFDGRVAVITGAGRGLGRAYAMLLAERGAAVVINDLGVTTMGKDPSRAPADEAVAEITARGGRAVANFGDAGEEADAKAMVDQALEAFGRLDIVIANAGGVESNEPFGQMTRAVFDSMLRTHLGGPFAISREAWPHMAAQGYGRIVITSSPGALGVEGIAHYCAAKAGALGLMRALSVEGPKHGIHANAVMPGASTRLMAANTGGEGRPGGPAQTGMPNLPAEMVAPAVAWMAHEDCQANGEIVSAGGGFIGGVFYGLAPGYAQQDLTIETARDHWAEASDPTGYTLGATLADAGGAMMRKLAPLWQA